MLPPIGLRPRREQGERPQGGDLEFLKLVILSGEESNPDPKLKTCVAEVFWLPDASPCALATEEAEKNRISRMTRKGEGRQTRHCRSERKDQQRRDIVSRGLVFFKISRQSGQDLPKNTKVKRKTIRGQTEFQQLWIFQILGQWPGSAKNCKSQKKDNQRTGRVSTALDFPDFGPVARICKKLQKPKEGQSENRQSFNRH